MKRLGIVVNPAAEVAALAKYNKTRERSLSTQELTLVWGDLSLGSQAKIDPVRRFLRINLLLGGQRCEQLNHVKIQDVNLDENTITLFDPKGRRAVARRHVLPLTVNCRVEVDAQIRMAQDTGSPFLFPGKNAQSFLRADRISKWVTEESRRLILLKNGMQPFQYSDLRRTTESQMIALRIDKDVRAQILSHDLSGVQTRNYERHDYTALKREALEKWAAYLRDL
jgi:integrase